MIRWVSPVKQFMRTATEDSVVRGVTIAAGESVLLSYPSANRDEDVFDDADIFDVGRDPNRHLAFGFGAHYCLGAHLARIEGRALYSRAGPSLPVDRAGGQPEYMRDAVRRRTQAPADPVHDGVSAAKIVSAQLGAVQVVSLRVLVVV